MTLMNIPRIKKILEQLKRIMLSSIKVAYDQFLRNQNSEIKTFSISSRLIKTCVNKTEIIENHTIN